MNPIADTLLAVLASIAGDTDGAQNHLAAARRHSQAATRRQRQLIEIATLVVAGRRERASGLALVHLAEFPQDQELLDEFRRSSEAPGHSDDTNAGDDDR